MAAVTVNQIIKAREPRGLMQGKAAASVNLYQGTMCFFDGASGDIEPDDQAAANNFAGVVKHQRDNSGGVAQALDVEFYTRGVFQFPSSGLGEGNNGDIVHAIDNYTCAASGGVVCGKQVRLVSANLIEVDIGVSG